MTATETFNPRRVNHVVVVRAVALTLLAALALGCGGAFLPRTNGPLKWKDWAEEGALVDASRAHPIAFWTDPQRKPVAVEAFGGSLQATQWMMHLALKMNEAIRTKTLYDGRFTMVSPKLFAYELNSGRYTYTFRAKPSELSDMIRRSGARTVEVRFGSAKPVRVGSDTGVRVMVEVVVGGLKRSYTADSTDSVHWDAECMNAVARKILGDPRFWDAVKVM